MQALHQGRYAGDDGELYLPLAQATFQHLDSGLSFGWHAPDPKLRQWLSANVLRFSGFKTLAVQQQMAQHLADAEGNLQSFAQFRAAALAVHEQYNVRYLRTEYEQCIASAQMASRWAEFEPDAMLRYDTAGDDHVRTDHQAYDGITRPRDDPFWRQHYPPCDWACRCTVVQVADDTPPSPPEATQGLPPVPAEFRPNVGQTGTVFDLDHHAYGDVSARLAGRVEAQLPAIAPKVAASTSRPFDSDEMALVRATGARVSGPGSDAQLVERLRELLPGAELPELASELQRVAKQYRFKWVDAQWRVTGQGADTLLELEYAGGSARDGVRLTRTIGRENGTLYASHDYLTLPKKLQKLDCSRAINRAMYRQYQLAGVQEIRVHAALQAGGYAWASAGFEATNLAELYELLDPQTRARWNKPDKPCAALPEALLGELRGQLDKHAELHPKKPFPIHQWAKTSFGKDLLVGTHWHGKLDLTNPDQVRIFEQYLQPKKTP